MSTVLLFESLLEGEALLPWPSREAGKSMLADSRSLFHLRIETMVSCSVVTLSICNFDFFFLRFWCSSAVTPRWFLKSHPTSSSDDCCDSSPALSSPWKLTMSNPRWHPFFLLLLFFIFIIVLNYLL